MSLEAKRSTRQCALIEEQSEMLRLNAAEKEEIMNLFSGIIQGSRPSAPKTARLVVSMRVD